MAEKQQLEEPTEKATPKREMEARKKGQIARSRELSTMGVTLSAALAFMVFGDAMLKGISTVLVSGLSPSFEQIHDRGLLFEPLKAATLHATMTLSPLLLVVVIAAVVSPAALGGWSFSASAMAFKAERINPLAGLKRLFALRGLVELLKALAKFLLVGGVAIVVLMSIADELLGLSRLPVLEALETSGQLIILAFVWFSASLILIAAVDVPFQAWDHMKKMRMTKQEIKDESKETEGRPEIKGRLRQMQQEAAGKRMLEDIPIASVVVTNPTHFAVALKYEGESMQAPKVLAKGADHMAARIREVANEHGVPLFEAPPLARALFASTEIGDDIPEELYLGVAQVLTYIYQLDNFVANGGLEPRPPELDAIDESRWTS